MERARQYQDVADNLAPFATGISGSTGQEVFQASYLIAPQPPGGNPLDTYALWPAGTIGLGSDPATLLVAQNTIKSVDSWAQGNAFPQVRCGDATTHLSCSTNNSNKQQQQEEE